MRTRLVGSLLDVLRHNAAHGMPDAGIFEVGAVYLPARAAPRSRDEPQHLGGALSGALRPAGLAAWRAAAAPTSSPPRAIWARRSTRCGVPVVGAPGAEPFLHPGRAAEVLLDGEVVGWLGEVHPLVARAWDLEAVAAFEVDLDRVLAAAPEVLPFRDLVSFPAVVQDIAVVVGDDVPAERVLEIVRAAGRRARRRRASSTSTGASRWGRGASRWRCAWSSAPPTARSPTRRPPCGAPIVRALADEVGGELRG